MRLAAQMISIEWRKRLAYRMDFWVGFAGDVAFQLLVAIFLWGAVFEARGAEIIEGFSYQGMILYCLLVGLVHRMLTGSDIGPFAHDIYTGLFTRYILYPASVLGQQLMIFFANMLLYGQQLALGLILYFIFFDLPGESQLSVTSLAAGCVVCLFSGYLFFIMNFCIECVAFWVESVWTLIIMLRFIVMLLGGGMIPLAMFPERAHELLVQLPFYLVIGLPVEVFLGRVGLHECVPSLAACAIWAGAFTLLARWLLRRGAYSYTGVGI